MSELIAATETALTDGEADQFVLMRVGTQDIAFAIQDVRDAVEPNTITPIPLAPSAIAGVMNLRGRIVTAIDLRRILTEDGDDCIDNRIDNRGREYSQMIGITVDRPEGPYTLLVDSVSDVRRIERALLEKPPATLDPALKRLCAGVFQLPDRLVVLLDVDRILEPETILATPTIPFLPRRVEPMIEERKPNSDASVEMLTAAADAALTAHEAPTVPDRAVVDAQVPENFIANAMFGRRIEKQAGDAPAESAPPKYVSAPPPRVLVPILEGIGGEAALSKIVAAVYDEILADPSLADFFADADMSMQHGRMVAALARHLATRGSRFKTASMGYEWLVPEKGMEDHHFTRCLAHFEQVLDRLAIEKTQGDRFLAAIEWCREGVVD